MVKFGYTIIYVEDVAETLSFYEKAFGFSRKFITDEKDYAELVTGETTLAFASILLAEKNGFSVNLSENSVIFPFELALVTDDVESLWSHAITSGAKELKKPEKKPWGQIVAYVQDNNGHIVEICSPMQ